jgi:hypothetical protein
MPLSCFHEAKVLATPVRMHRQSKIYKKFILALTVRANLNLSYALDGRFPRGWSSFGVLRSPNRASDYGAGSRSAVLLGRVSGQLLYEDT